MPDRKHNNLDYLHDDEPLQPCSLLVKHTGLVDAVITGRRVPNHCLQERHQNVEASKDPLHDGVNGLHRLRGLGDKAMRLHLDVITLPDVEFEECSVHEVCSRCVEP